MWHVDSGKTWRREVSAPANTLSLGFYGFQTVVLQCVVEVRVHDESISLSVSLLRELEGIRRK